VPYPNDRRKHQTEGDEVVSPEYLEMLIATGGAVRPSNPEAARRRSQDLPYGRRKDDMPRPEPDRRRAGD
jgi:hypothetical protein